MIKSDLHTHTVFSDGKNSAEEMVLSALKKGLKTIGISDHSYTFFDTSWCIKKEEINNYKAEIRRLKEKYKDKIEVLCGAEQDLYSLEPLDGYDYAIGSVHYLKCNDAYIPVDESALITKNAILKYFKGDANLFAEHYFNAVSEFVHRKEIKIIGHFDLLTKFNEQEKIFDESNPVYISAWQKCADKLVSSGKVFEINTGAISRGLRSAPYPSDKIIKYISSKGGKFILSSDAHKCSDISFMFNELEEKYNISFVN